MKGFVQILSFILVLFGIACTEEEPESIPQGDYYLKGGFKDSKILDLEYPNESLSEKYFGDYYWSVSSDKSFASEGPILTFPLNIDNSEYLAIVFHQKFDASRFNYINELPLIKTTDVLVDTLESMNLQFYSSFRNNADTQGVEIRYFDGTGWWHSYKYEHGEYSSKMNNENHHFDIIGISSHTNVDLGEGLIIEGIFTCKLYKYDSPSETILCDNMKYLGFLKFPR